MHRIYDTHLADELSERTIEVNFAATQNAVLHIAKGCNLMAAKDHLIMESKVLPTKLRNKMISKQYLTSCCRKPIIYVAILNTQVN